MNDKPIRSAVANYSSGCCTVTEFLSSVSHCCDNVTHPLNQNADIGSSTEEHEYELDDVDDNTRSPVSVIQQLQLLLYQLLPQHLVMSALMRRVSKLPYYLSLIHI